MKYLIDSNIIIYHLNGENIATSFLVNNKNQCSISQISYIEILSFSFTPEQEADVKAFLEGFKIIDITRDIAIQAIKNRKIKKIKVPDNIIAASAQVNDLILVTRNISDFSSLDVRFFNPLARN
ncbi:MAG: type II toxin-antitoxin system VapC family toxin [Methylococcales bacterium]|nr:type II toxin-antitoxin system VapC family toxin [Methylococcales bacterium]